MTNIKETRQQLIIDIVSHRVIRTQDELVDALADRGIRTTQATLSRDLRELRVHKIIDSDGVVRFVNPNQVSHFKFDDKFMSIISSSFVSVDSADNLVVLKTLSGMAQAAAAVLDSHQYPGILGTVAGDDTILIVCRTREAAEYIVESLRPFGENNA